MSDKPTMYILRGHSGSGKSTWARSLAARDPNVVICSADDFFVGEDGQYVFDGDKIGEAHSACRNKAFDAVEARLPVVIDNTNYHPNQFAYYSRLAFYRGYQAVVVNFLSPDVLSGINDVDSLIEFFFERNQKGCTHETLRRQIETCLSTPVDSFHESGRAMTLVNEYVSPWWLASWRRWAAVIR